MCAAEAKLPMEIDCQTVKGWIDAGEKFLLLDCREPDEHATAKIDAARLIPMGELLSKAAELEAFKEGPVVVHCHRGGRSLKVTHWLRQNGFDKAQSLAGGIDRWAQEIEPGLARY